MNKAFEKILDRLVTEVTADTTSEYDNGIKSAISIVQEVTKEYNNGWIPCSERLPDEHKLYDITFRNDVGNHSDSAIYNPYLERWLWDSDETELVDNEVLAWADKREPYHPEGE